MIELYDNKMRREERARNKQAAKRLAKLIKEYERTQKVQLKIWEEKHGMANNSGSGS